MSRIFKITRLSAPDIIQATIISNRDRLLCNSRRCTGTVGPPQITSAPSA